MRGMPFACIARSAIHPLLPILAAAKSGWTIADYGLPILEMATLSHNATMRSVRRVRAVRSAVTLQLQHLRHLRWRVSCATRVRRRPMAPVLWTNVRGTDAKPCASACASQVYWCRCAGRSPEASHALLVSMPWASAPGIGTNVRTRQGLP